MYIIGLMSGTSLDGVDAALVRFEGATPRLIAGLTLAYPDALLSRLRQLCTDASNDLHLAMQADALVAEHFADAVHALLARQGLTASEITAIGSHGQTIRHEPDGDIAYSLQIGDANRIASLTGIDTVADFRRKDIALGGQGAPLVPAVHQALFAQAGVRRGIVNIGGIANLTVLPGDEDDVLGFDTGPGNTLMDAWCLRHTNQPYDEGGRWARQGSVSQALLRQLLSDPYFARPAPKSTGREYFHLQWLEQHLAVMPGQLRAEDVQASLLALTAHSISEALRGHHIQECYLCGGGAANDALVAAMSERGVDVRRTDDLGVDSDQLEAMAFAWLAWAHLHGRSGNLPSVTGASRRALLGAFYPAG